MDQKGDAALQRLKAQAARMRTVPDPTVVSDLAIWAASKVTRRLVDSATWTDFAVRELGEWVKPHLDAAWEASKKLLETELTSLEKKVGKGLGTVVRKKVSEMTPTETVADLTGKLQKKFADKDFKTVTPLVKRLSRTLVEQGFVVGKI